MFELGKELLDLVQVWRIFWQENQLGAGLSDCLSDGIRFVGAEIVHDDDIAWTQCRDQDLLDIDQKALTIDRPLDQPGRLDPVVAERRQKGHGVPVAERGLARQALASWRPSPQGRHVGLGPGLVDEDQARRVDTRLKFQPLRPTPGDVGAVLLAGDQRLFL